MQDNGEAKEDLGNVEFFCEECSKKLYPAKGKFTKEILRYATHVKKVFGREHMWVKILKLTEKYIIGTVDNVPVFPESPPYGAKVRVTYPEVEDAI